MSESQSASGSHPVKIAKADGGLKKDLKNRHIQMIALGGAIGTGLFYGSADSIGIAGPSVLLAYLIGGIVIFLVVRAMGEMSVHTPSSGAFSYYAYKNWSERAGFVSGWNYWFNYIAVAMAELAVVGTYVNYWFPDVPTWLTALVVLVTITAVNLVGVKSFGEVEFWFALIKVAAIIGMIILGVVVVIFGINSNPDLPDPSFAHLFDNGGFFPFGATGMMFSLVVVMFSFGGIELIGITAGEADNPKKAIPKAINQVIYRILIFYIGALTVIMAVVPYTEINDKFSPFVQIFDSIGITFAAHILNFVVLTAALSVYNSGLYSNGRMLYSLSQQGNAPKIFGRVGKNGCPYVGVLFSSFVTLFAVILLRFLPQESFGILMAVALSAGIINWTMIMVTELKFRKRIGADAVQKLDFKLPGGLFSSVLVIVFLGVIVVLMAYMDKYRPSVIGGAVWLCVLIASYEIKRLVGDARQNREDVSVS